MSRKDERLTDTLKDGKQAKPGNLTERLRFAIAKVKQHYVGTFPVKMDMSAITVVQICVSSGVFAEEILFAFGFLESNPDYQPLPTDSVKTVSAPSVVVELWSLVSNAAQCDAYGVPRETVEELERKLKNNDACIDYACAELTKFFEFKPGAKEKKGVQRRVEFRLGNAPKEKSALIEAKVDDLFRVLPDNIKQVHVAEPQFDSEKGFVLLFDNLVISSRAKKVVTKAYRVLLGDSDRAAAMHSLTSAGINVEKRVESLLAKGSDEEERMSQDLKREVDSKIGILNIASDDLATAEHGEGVGDMGTVKKSNFKRSISKGANK